ncbi:MAG: undecaprenyl-diphosphatase UppP [Blastocatellia bacterium]|nr:undecaprenyl-diphosphatase UppP [Blastocatellia bacterium]
MSLLQAIILGLVQGLTEFIPVSSTAHLVIAGKILHIDRQLSPEQITAFDAVIQLGSLVAVLIYFAGDLRRITVGFLVDHVEYFKGNRDAGNPVLGSWAQLGYLIVLGTIPIVVLGLTLKKIIEGTLTKDLYVIGGTMIGLAVVLAVAEVVGKRTRSLEQLTWKDALMVGFAQAFALIPGASRSGTTITGGLFVGMNRETAARFSFLLSIPAVGAAGLLEFIKEYKHLSHNMGAAVVVGTLVAGISGYASIAFLMRYLREHSTYLFIGYRLIVGAVIYILLLTHTVTPN